MTNYSYYLLPVIFILCPVSGSRGPMMRLKLDDNVNPRLALDRAEKSGKFSPRLIAKLRRRESCEKNSWEGLPAILAAVVAGNAAGVNEKWMNGVTAAYIAIRIAYIWAYTNIESKAPSFLRSALWWAGNFCSIITFVKAGNALNRKLI